MSEQPQAFGVGSFMWRELKTRDLAKSKEFYAEVAGWTYEDMDMGPAGTYTLIKVEGRNVGGIEVVEDPDTPSHWSYYVAVEDVQATSERVEGLGGKLLHDMIEVPGVGKFRPISAPDESHLFLMTPVEHDTEAPSAEPGSFLWIELMSRDFERARDFYCALLGWETAEVPMPYGPYTLFNAKSGGAGGGLSSPAGIPDSVPSLWIGYVHVADLDAAVEAVKTKGGQVAIPPQEVPGVGRFVHVVGPAGSAVALMTPA